MLNKNTRQKGISWNVLFGVMAWLLWTKRNVTIFQNEKEGVSSVAHQALIQAGEIHKVWSQILMNNNIYRREMVEIKWTS